MESKLLVAVPRPLRSALTYSIKETNSSVLGTRVIVPLGHTRSLGIALAFAEQTESTESYAIKPIHSVLDEEPILDAHLLELLQWAARYYHYPIGEVLFTALPVALRDGNALPDHTRWSACISENATTLLKRAKRQQALYEWLSQQPPEGVEAAVLRQHFGSNWRDYLNGLLEKGLAQIVSDTGKPALQLDITQPTHINLTADQQACLKQCQHWVNQPKPSPILLQGVTGSGKTEIYLRLIEATLAAGKQTLVLVPEIGLTPQLLQRFTSHFPTQPIVCLHSGLNDTERLQAWLKARQQHASIILGTRSAIFTPCPQLGLIIVDEEHDVSLKQQESFRYHARDLAIKRAQLLGIPIVLGSATPSLESLHNAERGRFYHSFLKQRPGSARAPSVEVQNIRGHHLQAGLSQQTIQAIEQTLQRNEQVMLFINRRGFAPVLLCSHCGWQAVCPSCNVNMTYHARHHRLICHHCGYERPTDTDCPQCDHPQLTTQGQGTERIELSLQQRFPHTPVVRIDRDSTSRKGALQERLNMVANHQRLLLVGTQMLAKGHDFPNLTLVVILDADQALLSAEYHALERFGQLMTQVAGRSGRSEKAGRVILQTTQPQHPMLVTLLQQGYAAFASYLLSERQRWNFPPFSYQALIRADAPDMEKALAFLQQLRELLAESTDLYVLGPVPAPMEKRAGRYRAQLLLQSNRREVLHTHLQYLTSQEKSLRNQRAVRWSMDVDPIELS